MWFCYLGHVIRMPNVLKYDILQPCFQNITFINSSKQERYILNIAAVDGGPIYCFMSALSTKAMSIFSVIFEVVRITTLGYLQDKSRFLGHMYKNYLL